MPDCAQQAAQGGNSFWSRQFVPERTGAQIVFDVLFGILLPAFCVCFDPIVFRAGFGPPLLSGFEVAALGFIGVSMVSLAVWLSVGRPAAMLCGFLTAGAIFAAALGWVLLPYSIPGSFLMLIGLLGFTPFVTAFVFARNAVGAARRAHHSQRTIVVPALVGMAIAGGAPWATQRYVTGQTSRAFELLKSADPVAATEGLTILKRLRYLIRSDELVDAYVRTGDPTRRQRLADAYRELTGASIQDRAAEMWDDD